MHTVLIRSLYDLKGVINGKCLEGNCSDVISNVRTEVYVCRGFGPGTADNTIKKIPVICEVRTHKLLEFFRLCFCL
jgi:hypothetical protein